MVNTSINFFHQVDNYLFLIPNIIYLHRNIVVYRCTPLFSSNLMAVLQQEKKRDRIRKPRKQHAQKNVGPVQEYYIQAYRYCSFLRGIFLSFFLPYHFTTQSVAAGVFTTRRTIAGQSKFANYRHHTKQMDFFRAHQCV